MTPYYLKMKEYWRVLNKARPVLRESFMPKLDGTWEQFNEWMLARRMANNESCSHPKGD